ncbi:MAG: cupin domain-containing protein [Verrucomicrobiota bacterium]
MKSEYSGEALVVPDGPQIQFVPPILAKDDAPCVMQALLPAGFVMPIHSHKDREVFVLLTGQAEGYDGTGWVTVREGDIFDVPGGCKHAWRNTTAEPASMLIVATARLGHFFRELARLAAARTSELPSQEELRHFQKLAAEYGYWMGSPEENAAVGIAVPRPAREKLARD